MKPMDDATRLAGLREVIRAANGDWHEATALWSVQADLDWLLKRAEATPVEPPVDARGTCWFCKGEFVIGALIAGFDTFEEQRLACLACNERMSGNWHSTPVEPPVDGRVIEAFDVLGAMWSWSEVNGYFDTGSGAVLAAARILREVVGRPAQPPAARLAATKAGSS